MTPATASRKFVSALSKHPLRAVRDECSSRRRARSDAPYLNSRLQSDDSSHTMNALLRKEIRLLLPSWIAAILLAIVPVWLSTDVEAESGSRLQLVSYWL